MPPLGDPNPPCLMLPDDETIVGSVTLPVIATRCEPLAEALRVQDLW